MLNNYCKKNVEKESFLIMGVHFACHSVNFYDTLIANDLQTVFRREKEIFT